MRLLTKRFVRNVGDSAEVSAQLPVRLSPRSEPQPDFAILKAGGYRDAHPVPSDVLLLVEVSDFTWRYDFGVKARLYANHRIPEYWVIDRVDNRVVCCSGGVTGLCICHGTVRWTTSKTGPRAAT